MVRIQVLLSPEEKEAFKRAAARSGLSLSAWLRQVGLAQLEASRERGRFRSAEDLTGFFRTCAGHHGSTREPDWSEHLETIRRSRSEGSSET